MAFTRLVCIADSAFICYKKLLCLINYSIVSHTYTFLKPEEDKYVPNMTSNDNRMEIRKNWDMLMPRTYQPLSFSYLL